MAFALALCTPTQQGASASGWTISRVCAYFRPLLLDVLRYTGASGRSRRPLMGPANGIPSQGLVDEGDAQTQGCNCGRVNTHALEVSPLESALAIQVRRREIWVSTDSYAMAED